MKCFGTHIDMLQQPAADSKRYYNITLIEYLTQHTHSHTECTCVRKIRIQILIIKAFVFADDQTPNRRRPYMAFACIVLRFFQ